MRTPARLLLVLVALAAVALGVSACGGDKASGKSVSELLKDTFSGGKSVNSGRLDIGLSLDLQGLQGVNGPVTAKLSGPFKTKKGEIPEFDLDLTFSASGQTFAAGATSIGGKGFLSFQGSDYAVPATVFAAFQDGFKKAQKQQSGSSSKSNPSLKSLGIDPSRWLTGAKKAGEEKVGGADTVRITAGVDVRKLLEDVNVLLERAAGLGISRQQKIPTKLTAAQIDQLAGAVDSARFEVFIGKKDVTLRRLVFDLGVNVPAASQQAANGLKSARIRLTLQIDDLNGDVNIKAPAKPKPFEQLQRALGGITGAGIGATGATGTGGTGTGSTGTGSTGTGSSTAAANAYLDCINAATTDQARAACVAKLSQP